MTNDGLGWRERAACVGRDPELFFAVGSGERAERQIAAAKQVCAACPVTRRCAEVALASGYEGVWGGLDDGERRRLRQRRVIRACQPRR